MHARLIHNKCRDINSKVIHTSFPKNTPFMFSLYLISSHLLYQLGRFTVFFFTSFFQKLTIVDTVGYGDQINKEDSFKAVVDYIDAQFEAYLQEELKIKRSLSTYHDTRIHVCLYFICPTGHGLKSIDLVCMKKLDTKVNIIPIIAKADTISKTELQKFKVKIQWRTEEEGCLVVRTLF